MQTNDLIRLVLNSYINSKCEISFKSRLLCFANHERVDKIITSFLKKPLNVFCIFYRKLKRVAYCVLQITEELIKSLRHHIYLIDLKFCLMIPKVVQEYNQRLK